MTDIQPFELGEYPYTTTDSKIIGMFDIQYEFDYFTDEDETVMDAWLCHNCTKNFIFFKNMSQQIAGGHNDPKADWEYRQSADGEPHDILATHYIRLHTADIMLFEMVWLSHLQPPRK